MSIPLTEQMREYLKEFIDAYPVTVGWGGMISHPVLSHVAVMNEQRELVVLKTQEDFKRQIDIMWSYMTKAGTLDSALVFINKQYRITALHYVSFLLTPKQTGELLADFWIQTEWPHQHGIRRLLFLFNQTKGHLMDKNEQKLFDSLPDEIVVYRGLQGKKAKAKGFSWTTDEWRARWFANRWKTQNKVFRAKIRKEDVFMYTDARNEKEVILNPYKLKEIEEI